MESLEVRVQEKHILSGRRSSRFYCPVALAIKEQFPKSKVVVQLDTISIDGVEYATPKPAAMFMGGYDRAPRKIDVPPATFHLKKRCSLCQHEVHEPGDCRDKVWIKGHGVALCRCGEA